MEYLVEIDDGTAIGLRYPPRITIPEGTIVIHEHGSARDHPAARIVNRRGATIPADWPLLMSVAAIDAADAEGVVIPQHALAYLPFARSPELRRLHEDVVTPVLRGRLTIPVGRPVGGAWDDDVAVAEGMLEALVFGGQLASSITGSEVDDAAWVGSHPPEPLTGVVAWRCGSATVVQEMVPAGRTLIGGWSAAIDTADARFVLRDEFALGSYGRRREGGSWEFPRVPIEKPNVQAPDSVIGGWETVELLRALVGEAPADFPAADDVRRLLGHAGRLLDERAPAASSAGDVR